MTAQAARLPDKIEIDGVRYDLRKLLRAIVDMLYCRAENDARGIIRKSV